MDTVNFKNARICLMHRNSIPISAYTRTHASSMMHMIRSWTHYILKCKHIWSHSETNVKFLFQVLTSYNIYQTTPSATLSFALVPLGPPTQCHDPNYLHSTNSPFLYTCSFILYTLYFILYIVLTFINITCTLNPLPVYSCSSCTNNFISSFNCLLYISVSCLLA